MSRQFERVVTDAVTLLRNMPRGRGEVARAREQHKRFRSSHPGIRTDLLVDQPPASNRVDYDLLLAHPAGGTVAVSWQGEAGVPWAVDYADHWAANIVVSVNQHVVTIRDVLLFIKATGQDVPDLMAEMIDHALIGQALAEHRPAVSRRDLQSAADIFRTTHGLHGAQAAEDWLKEAGLSASRLNDIARRLAERQALVRRVTANRVRAYFEAHRNGFDLVSHVRVAALRLPFAAGLARDARKRGLLAAAQALMRGGRHTTLTGTISHDYAQDLPQRIAEARTGSIVGPSRTDGGFAVFEITRRRKARLDLPTRAAIREALFEEWLAERRECATIRWQWL